MNAYNWQLWGHARRIGLTSCGLLILIVSGCAIGLLPHTPPIYLAIGFGLSTALRQLALMTAILRWSRRHAR